MRAEGSAMEYQRAVPRTNGHLHGANLGSSSRHAIHNSYRVKATLPVKRYQVDRRATYLLCSQRLHGSTLVARRAGT